MRLRAEEYYSPVRWRRWESGAAGLHSCTAAAMQGEKKAGKSIGKGKATPFFQVSPSHHLEHFVAPAGLEVDDEGCVGEEASLRNRTDARTPVLVLLLPIIQTSALDQCLLVWCAPIQMFSFFFCQVCMCCCAMQLASVVRPCVCVVENLDHVFMYVLLCLMTYYFPSHKNYNYKSSKIKTD